MSEDHKPFEFKIDPEKYRGMSAQEATEEKRKANEARRKREADAEERWQEEYERRMMLWTASGGAESDFDAAWPEIRHKLFVERVSGDEARRQRAAFDGFRF